MQGYKKLGLYFNIIIFTFGTNIHYTYPCAHKKEVTIHHLSMRAPLQDRLSPCRRTCQGLDCGSHTLWFSRGDAPVTHTNNIKVKLNASYINCRYCRHSSVKIYLQVPKQPTEGEDSCCILVVFVVFFCSTCVVADESSLISLYLQPL